jgi:hypothetical protein
MRLYHKKVIMPESVLYHPDQPDLLAALADAEWEMYELGSCLNIPGNVRLRLLQAATRAQQLIDRAHETDKMPSIVRPALGLRH